MKKLNLKLRPLEGKDLSIEADMLYFHDEKSVICIVPDGSRQMALLKGGNLVVVKNGQSDAPISYGESFLRFDKGICNVSVFG